MSVQISDCTIRDGGYLTGKNFSDQFISGVIDGLVKAGIDYVETGFLQTQVNGEALVYHNSRDVRKYIPAFKGQTEFVGFCDNSRYAIDDLDNCDGKSFESLRISFAKHEWREALGFCAMAKEKGYHVFVHPGHNFCHILYSKNLRLFPYMRCQLLSPCQTAHHLPQHFYPSLLPSLLAALLMHRINADYCGNASQSLFSYPTSDPPA